ncbi:MAG: efflux transporter periplasmic adaptor subunit [Sphingomonas sp.]|nr:MAG: efflux transporter periplasmic adaptor subunit [Sphingomonas sp.]
MDRRIERRPRARWPLVLAAVAAPVAAFAVWRLLPETGSTDIAAADIRIGTVQRAAFDDYLPVRATVAPRLTTLVGAMAGGQVETLHAQDGELVKAGQPLATLANPELKLEVLTREAQIAAQLGDVSGQDLSLQRDRLDRSAQIAQANYELIRARRDLSIREQLHSQGFVSDAGVESFAEEAQYREARLKQLQGGQSREAGISATQGARLADTRQRLSSNLSAVRASLDALVIKAPMAGRLTNFIIQPGQALKAGDPAGQVDSEGAWKLEADVDEYFLGRVQAGQRGRTSDGAPLSVLRVLPAVKDGRFRTELLFEGETPAGLKRGQTVDVRVTLGSSGVATVAPVGGWLDSGAGGAVFVLDADGRHARRREVKVGRRNPEQAEILSGLEPGEKIIISSTSAIKSYVLNIR